MKRKNLMIVQALILTGLCFAFGCDNQESSTGQLPQATSQTKDTVSQSSKPSDQSKIDYADVLKGKFIFEDATCAGLDFISPETIAWTNEIACDMPDTLRLNWTGTSSFFVRTKYQATEGCPPRVDIYEVQSYNGADLVLKSYWTGWGENQTEVLRFKKSR